MTSDDVASKSLDEGPLSIMLTQAEGHAVSTLDAVIEAVITALDDGKAEDIIKLDLQGKSTMADAMVIASGGSSRHINALMERLLETLGRLGIKGIKPEGARVGDWVLIDGGLVIIHLFRPEVRTYYDLERLWSEDRPEDKSSDL